MDSHTRESAEENYRRLLLSFADATGQLDQLHNYINDSALEAEFPFVDFESLRFEMN